MLKTKFLHVALIASTFSLACSQAPTTNDATADSVSGTQAVEANSDALLYGKEADDKTFPAVGALVYYLPEIGVLDVFCSGTLVGGKAVVTARHCTPSIDNAFAFGVLPAIAFGPNAFEPTQVVPITSYVAAPAGPGPSNGLLLDGGRDVAVAYLESKPDHIKPVKLGLFDGPRMLGKKLTAAGYGVYDPAYLYGEKFSGTVTARALSGKWYKLLFDGNYKAYHDWYFTDSPAAIPSEDEAKQWWDLYKLETNYELLAGGLPGDALGCFGDSGGPLFSTSHGCDPTLVGVSFAVEASKANVCMGGGGYLVFNRKMLDFVEGAVSKK
jgi:hypothetical protein